MLLHHNKGSVQEKGVTTPRGYPPNNMASNHGKQISTELEAEGANAAVQAETLTHADQQLMDERT